MKRKEQGMQAPEQTNINNTNVDCTILKLFCIKVVS